MNILFEGKSKRAKTGKSGRKADVGQIFLKFTPPKEPDHSASQKVGRSERVAERTFDAVPKGHDLRY